jgi:hypothetical protein
VKLGLFALNQNAAARRADLARLAGLAEELGYESL